MKKSIQLAALIGAVSMFSACSDDVTEVYNGTTGMSVLGEGEKLSKQACDESNIGEMLYVTDESAAFFCNGEKWETLKGEDGKDGEDGKNGKNGEDGKDGNTCSVKQSKDKSVTTITCETEDGKVSYDVKNGKNGKDGKDGDDGYSCSAKQNSDKTVTTITCETKDGKVSYKVRNGADGADGGDGNDGSGCKVVDNGDGAVNIVCGEGKGESSTEVFKAMCGVKPYDPEIQACVDGVIVEACDSENFGKNDDEYCLDTRDMHVYGTTLRDDLYWMKEDIVLEKGRKYVVANPSYYGYTWENAQNACPDGWHVPDQDEWNALFESVGKNRKDLGKMFDSDSKYGVVLTVISHGGSALSHGQTEAAWTTPNDEGTPMLMKLLYSVKTPDNGENVPSSEIRYDAVEFESSANPVHCVMDVK